MGMAILHRVDRIADWAVITGSIAGEGKDVVAVSRSPQGYEIAKFIHVSPLETTGELEARVIQPFLEELPKAPRALFTCLDQSWLLAVGYPNAPENVFQLAYVSTGDSTTEGVTEIRTLLSDGSSQAVILHKPMLVMGLATSPDGERIAFWGCPGSLASDCLPDEGLDVWTVDWDGSNPVNLTEGTKEGDSHPTWSPDGSHIAFDSWRSGKAEVYIMEADGTDVRQLTEGVEDNSEPKWSADGRWIAYHCSQAGETQICIVSPEGKPAGTPISGTTPLWQPSSPEGDARLAFLCFQEAHSDLCTAAPDGSDIVNLTNTPSDEHSASWSPDGNWLAFVSNRANDIDIYKVCATCPGESVAVRLTDEVRFANWPAWSPDGLRLAYAHEPGGVLLLVNADRSDATYIAAPIFAPPIWRP
jgi:TolB protein